MCYINGWKQYFRRIKLEKEHEMYQSMSVVYLTWPASAFAIISNIEEKTRTLILFCSSAERPRNNSRTLFLAFSQASWYLNIVEEKYRNSPSATTAQTSLETFTTITSQKTWMDCLKTNSTCLVHFQLCLWYTIPLQLFFLLNL